jgi:hypothetical protein
MDEPQLDLELPEPDPFTAFWAVFPRRKDRIRAEANFKRALKVDAAANIIEGARRYAAAVAGWDASAVQLPDSWLSRERWRGYLPQAERWEPGPFYAPPKQPSPWEATP